MLVLCTNSRSAGFALVVVSTAGIGQRKLTQKAGMLINVRSVRHSCPGGCEVNNADRKDEAFV